MESKPERATPEPAPPKHEFQPHPPEFTKETCWHCNLPASDHQVAPEPVFPDPAPLVGEAPERIRVNIRHGKDDWIGIAYSSKATDPSKIYEYVTTDLATRAEGEICQPHPFRSEPSELVIGDRPLCLDCGEIESADAHDEKSVDERSDITCRGSYALGTACGKCARCKQESVFRLHPFLVASAAVNQSQELPSPPSENVKTVTVADAAQAAAREIALEISNDGLGWAKLCLTLYPGDIAGREVLDKIASIISKHFPDAAIAAQSTSLETNGYSRRIVSLEGRLELAKLRSTCDIGHEFIVGSAYRENGAANIANVERDLYRLNGQDVRVTIEWRDAAIAAQTSERQEVKMAISTEASETLKALVQCVIPYEALLADSESRKWIAPEIWQSIESAVAAVRQVVEAAKKGEKG